MEIKIRDIFGEEIDTVLRRIGAFAAGENVPSFLIGGVVRDSLLRKGSADIDVMLESDALEFIPKLAAAWPELFPSLPGVAKPITFKRYRTAKLPLLQPLKGGIECIDFSSARSEVYPGPGVAPIVSAGSFAADMLRRDFSVNALAVSLTPERYGLLEDTVGGYEDLLRNQLRILHPASFHDDPARIIRGLRFASRFNFGFEAQTERLFAEAVEQKLLGRLPGFRLYDEFLKALEEKDVASFLSQADARGVLAQVLPELTLESMRAGLQTNLAFANDSKLKPSELLFARLLREADDEGFVSIAKRFELPEKKTKLIDLIRR